MLAVSLVAAIFAASVEGSSPPTTAVQRYMKAMAVCRQKSDTDGQFCLGDLLEPSETDLDLAYKAALKRAAEQGRMNELKAAQAAWSKYQLAQCDFEHAQFRGGTAYQSIGYGCLIRLNAERIDDLSRGANQ